MVSRLRAVGVSGTTDAGEHRRRPDRRGGRDGRLARQPRALREPDGRRRAPHRPRPRAWSAVPPTGTTGCRNSRAEPRVADPLHEGVRLPWRRCETNNRRREGAQGAGIGRRWRDRARRRRGVARRGRARPGGAHALPHRERHGGSPAHAGAAAAAPRPKGRALGVDLVGGAVLTLPDGDGLRDCDARPDPLGRERRRRPDRDPRHEVGAPRRPASARAVPAAVGSGRSRVAVQDLPAGTWTVRVRRSADAAVRAAAPGPPRRRLRQARARARSGRPPRTLYPWKDGVLDRADVAVTGTDETGAAVPLTGDGPHRRREAAPSPGRSAATGTRLRSP